MVAAIHDNSISPWAPESMGASQLVTPLGGDWMQSSAGMKARLGNDRVQEWKVVITKPLRHLRKLFRRIRTTLLRVSLLYPYKPCPPPSYDLHNCAISCHSLRRTYTLPVPSKWRASHLSWLPIQNMYFNGSWIAKCKKWLDSVLQNDITKLSTVKRSSSSRSQITYGCEKPWDPKWQTHRMQRKRDTYNNFHAFFCCNAKATVATNLPVQSSSSSSDKDSTSNGNNTPNDPPLISNNHTTSSPLRTSVPEQQPQQDESAEEVANEDTELPKLRYCQYGQRSRYVGC